MNRHKALIIIQCIFLSFFIFGTMIICADTSGSKYLLMYDQLYSYGETTSQVIQLYINLKSEGRQVVLLQRESMKEAEKEEDTNVIIVASSFDSIEKYKDTIHYFKEHNYSIYEEKDLVSSYNEKGLLIGIDSVYPFSDLNKLMDIAEDLNNRGIKFICNVMPVYENYELSAFEKFIEVLEYVHKKGGEIFLHYPVINEEVTYDVDPQVGFEEAIMEYRNRGLSIDGIALPSSALFTGVEIFKDLDVHFLWVKENEERIDSKIDLLKVSEELNGYVFLNGVDINDFNDFKYVNSEDVNEPSLVYLSLNDDRQKMGELLNNLYLEKISIKDFEYENYNIPLINENVKDEIKSSDNQKTELDIFREEELKKIKGENLEKDQAPSKGYDISKFVRISIKIVGIIIFLLIVQVLIGRRYDNRKFFKD